MITDSFDLKTRPLTAPEYFYGERGHFADICFIIFSREVHAHLLASFECEKIGEIRCCSGYIPIYKFNLDGREVAFYLTFIGSALASQCCIESSWITGAEKFVMFGSAGSLSKDLTANKYVIPVEAYRDEGMSYHYAPPADYIKVKNHGRVAEIFDELNVPYIEGRVWTTDAPFRETVGQTALRRNDGCIAVEMEVAGVQAVCDFHGFELYDFLETGDVLFEDSYSHEGLHEANHNLRKLYVALEIAKRI